mmetsp:Transcript_2250/g.6701  ORF Transcript_2250/g.6701 Transcript_2250/m.6701 type:complete len:356 (-) Transcript_2250:1661-2728(-)
MAQVAEPPPSMFTLDGQHSRDFSRASQAAETAELEEATPAQPSTATEASAGPAASEIDLSRRVVPVIEVPDDVCSICLDEFTDEDPAQMTNCEHPYHLQCIMQWAQRSRECPMCFKHLQMKEDSLNELLPFGEYRPPEQDTTPAMLMGMDAWELDRLLARLAMGAGQQGRRGNRAARHAARAARHAQQAAASESAAAGALFGPPMLALPAPSRELIWSLKSWGCYAGSAHPSSAAHGRSGSGASAASPIDMHRSDAGASGDSYPASWPPANHVRTRSREPSECEPGDGAAGSGAADLRSRWASRAKATFSNTTKELRSFWGRAASSGHDAGDATNGSGAGASTQRYVGSSGGTAS